MTRRDDTGFTMVELLTTMLIFSIVSVSFYSVMFGAVRGGGDSQSIADVSQEARIGFNRMVRDIREAREISSATPTSVTIGVDYENDSLGTQTLTFSKSGDRILLNGEVLMEGVDCLRTTSGSACSQDVFRYTSNRLDFDWNRDGTTTWQELDEAGSATRGVVGVGNNDGQLNMELAYITDVTMSMTVNVGDASGRLIAQAQLRNRR